MEGGQQERGVSWEKRASGGSKMVQDTEDRMGGREDKGLTTGSTGSIDTQSLPGMRKCLSSYHL